MSRPKNRLQHFLGSNAVWWLGMTCIVLIILFSLIPGRWQVRSHFPGVIEHFVAYAGTGFIWLIALRGRATILLVLGLIGLAGLMEILQQFSPGRDPEIAGFAASTLGAIAGATLGYLARRKILGIASEAHTTLSSRRGDDGRSSGG
jgi:VanZ family protein